MAATWVEDDRVATLTRQIADHAASKQLSDAREAYATILREGLQPTKYTYAALINAHVASGDLPGALRTLEAMEGAGHVPWDVIFTQPIFEKMMVTVAQNLDLPHAQAPAGCTPLSADAVRSGSVMKQQAQGSVSVEEKLVV